MNPFADMLTPPLDRESVASEFRRIEKSGDHLNLFVFEPPNIGLAMFLADLVGAPESEWRGVIRKMGLGSEIYVYRSFCPMMQQIFEQRRKRLGY